MFIAALARGRRSGLAFCIVQLQLPKHGLHVSNVLPELVSWIIRSLVGHRTDFSYQVEISLVVWKPPVVDLGDLPDCCQSRSKLGRVEVPTVDISNSGDRGTQ